jgi:hypothetical protein
MPAPSRPPATSGSAGRSAGKPLPPLTHLTVGRFMAGPSPFAAALQPPAAPGQAAPAQPQPAQPAATPTAQVPPAAVPTAQVPVKTAAEAVAALEVRNELARRVVNLLQPGALAAPVKEANFFTRLFARGAARPPVAAPRPPALAPRPPLAAPRPPLSPAAVPPLSQPLPPVPPASPAYSQGLGRELTRQVGPNPPPVGPNPASLTNPGQARPTVGPPLPTWPPSPTARPGVRPVAQALPAATPPPPAPPAAAGMSPAGVRGLSDLVPPAPAAPPPPPSWLRRAGNALSYGVDPTRLVTDNLPNRWGVQRTANVLLSPARYLTGAEGARRLLRGDVGGGLAAGLPALGLGLLAGRSPWEASVAGFTYPGALYNWGSALAGGDARPLGEAFTSPYTDIWNHSLVPAGEAVAEQYRRRGPWGIARGLLYDAPATILGRAATGLSVANVERAGGSSPTQAAAAGAAAAGFPGPGPLPPPAPGQAPSPPASPGAPAPGAAWNQAVGTAAGAVDDALAGVAQTINQFREFVPQPGTPEAAQFAEALGQAQELAPQAAFQRWLQAGGQGGLATFVREVQGGGGAAGALGAQAVEQQSGGQLRGEAAQAFWARLDGPGRFALLAGLGLLAAGLLGGLFGAEGSGPLAGLMGLAGAGALAYGLHQGTGGFQDNRIFSAPHNFWGQVAGGARERTQRAATGVWQGTRNLVQNVTGRNQAPAQGQGAPAAAAPAIRDPAEREHARRAAEQVRSLLGQNQDRQARQVLLNAVPAEHRNRLVTGLNAPTLLVSNEEIRDGLNAALAPAGVTVTLDEVRRIRRAR